MQTLQVPRWLTEKEQTSLDQAIERDLRISNMRYPKRWITRRRDASIILFLLNTDVGLAELVAMRLGDVQIAESKGSMVVPSGKRSKPRTIPLNADARKTLQEWLAVRPQSDSDHVWVGVEGTNGGLSTRAVQRILDRYAAEAGLSALTAKACRHTFAKNLESLGVELEKIAMLLGLTNVNSTRIYKTPDDGNGNTESGLEKAVKKLEKKAYEENLNEILQHLEQRLNWRRQRANAHQRRHHQGERNPSYLGSHVAGNIRRPVPAVAQDIERPQLQRAVVGVLKNQVFTTLFRRAFLCRTTHLCS